MSRTVLDDQDADGDDQDADGDDDDGLRLVEAAFRGPYAPRSPCDHNHEDVSDDY